MNPRPDPAAGLGLNLGPRSIALLARAGIHTLDELRACGAVSAWQRARALDPKVSLNLLWALEGAISTTHWRIVAREQRTALLLAPDHARQVAP